MEQSFHELFSYLSLLIRRYYDKQSLMDTKILRNRHKGNEFVTNKQRFILDIYWTRHDILHDIKPKWDFSAVMMKGRMIYEARSRHFKASPAMNCNKIDGKPKFARGIFQNENQQGRKRLSIPPIARN